MSQAHTNIVIPETHFYLVIYFQFSVSFLPAKQYLYLSVYSIGSLIINFQVSFAIPLNKTLEELQKVFFNSFNASFGGELMQIEFAG